MADAYWRLALNLKGRLPDADVQVIEGLLDHTHLAIGVRASLHFALGAVLDAEVFTTGQARALRRPTDFKPRPARPTASYTPPTCTRGSTIG